MKIPINWLREFVATSETPEAIGERFFNLGFGLEGIENDTLDLEITPNRGDALSILGLAREYAAVTEKKVSHKESEISIPNDQKNDITITLNHPAISNYYAIVLTNVKNFDTPTIIKERLRAVGIEPICGLVDITNYIMHETGQPLHVFDIDKLSDKSIIFEPAKNAETITTLNNKTYQLTEGMIIGRDGAQIIDLVGIQGGKDSGVSETTTNVLLQGIIVAPSTIRLTSKKLRLSTDASYRFERGIDPGITKYATNQAATLLQKYGQAIISQVIDYTKMVPSKTIEFDWASIKRVLGTDIDRATATDILERLGFTINNTTISIPSWRQDDINFNEDICEEIARVYGYNNLNSHQLPKGTSSVVPTNEVWNSFRLVASKLRMAGFSEVQTYSFYSKTEGNPKESVEIANPLSEECFYLRSSILPLLIKTAEQNTWARKVCLFEIGTVFTKSAEETKVALLSTEPIKFIPAEKYNQNTRRKYFIWEGTIKELEMSLPATTPQFVFGQLPFRSISKYPPYSRDLSFIIDSSVQVEGLRKEIHNQDERVILVELLDVYQSDSFGNNKQSVTFQIVIDSKDQTLSTSTGDLIIKKITDYLTKTHDISLR